MKKIRTGKNIRRRLRGRESKVNKGKRLLGNDARNLISVMLPIVSISDYEVRVNLAGFVEMADGDYEIDEGFITGDGVYKVDFASLGIVEGFEKGNHTIKTEIVHDGVVLYSDEGVVEV